MESQRSFATRKKSKIFFNNSNRFYVCELCKVKYGFFPKELSGRIIIYLLKVFIQFREFV